MSDNIPLPVMWVKKDGDGCTWEKERKTEVEVDGEHKDDLREAGLSGAEDRGATPGCLEATGQ